MIARDLVKAVAAEVREAVKNLKLPDEHQSSRDARLLPVNVYEQFLPITEGNDTAFIPYVLVEWLGTTDELDGKDYRSISHVGLSMGTFAAESWSWQDPFHLTETVREHLLTHRLIAKKFRLIGDADWAIEPNRPAPFFYTYATLTYSTFQPVAGLF